MSGSLSDNTAEHATLSSALKKNLTSHSACAELARLFHVRPDEVALLRLDKGMLRFLNPPSLSAAGLIPLSISAVAARTVVTKTALVATTVAKMCHYAEVEAGTA